MTVPPYMYLISTDPILRAQLERHGEPALAALGAALNFAHGLPVDTAALVLLAHTGRIAVQATGDFPHVPTSEQAMYALAGASAAIDSLLGPAVHLRLQGTGTPHA